MADDKEELDFGDDVETEVKKLKLDEEEDDSELSKKVTELKAQLASDPNNAQLHAKLGQAYHALEQVEDALASYDKAIELDGKKASFYEQKALVLLDTNEIKSAKTLLHKALELEPNNATVLFDLGKACQTEDQKEALKFFKQAIEKNSHHTAAHASAGQILLQMGKPEDIKEAIPLFTSAIAVSPKDGQLRAKLIQCYDMVDNDAEREAARAALHAAYKNGQLNENYNQLNRYCCGQIETGNKFVMVWDHFKLDANNAVKYAFVVFNKGDRHEEKTLYRVTLTNSGNKFKLEAVHPDKTVALGEFDAEPSYKDVRAKALAHIAAN